MGNVSRRSFVKIAGVGAASLSFAGLLSACSADEDSSGSASNTKPSTLVEGQVIVAMNTGSEPAAGFDPLVSWGCGEHVHEPLIQSTLITTDVDMNFVNDLATSYECSEDGLTWTFIVRTDAKFTDGQPLTAEDVAFTLNGILESDGAQADLSMVSTVVALDAETVVITMKKPFSALLHILAVIGIVPTHAYDQSYGTHPIGSGRYMLEQWDQGQQVILVANPDYYGEKPLMERVVVVFMEEDAALAAVQAGQVDIAFTSAIFSDQQLSGYEMLACETVDSRGISLPIVEPGTTRVDGGTEYPAGNAVTSSLAVRQAINYAVDRDKLIENVLNGYGSPAYSVCDGMPWASADMVVKTNITQAQELLAKDGWVLGSDGVLEKDGVRASFDLIYSANDSARQALASEFANQLAEIGIEVKTVGLGWDDIYPRQFSDPVLWGWGSNSPSELYELNYSSGWGNFSCYENAESDAYFDAALAVPSIEDSYDLWHKAQWDGKQGPAPQGEATWVWLANVDHLYFKREDLDVAKQKPHPHGHGWSLVNNVDQWKWLA